MVSWTLSKFIQTDTIKRTKRETIGLDKVFANHVSDKRLGSRVYKELSESNSKKTTQSITDKALEIPLKTCWNGSNRLTLSSFGMDTEELNLTHIW